MGDNTGRFLGFAFAGADLAFELDGNGTVTFALGASNVMFGRRDSDLPGSDWSELFDPSDHELIRSLFSDLRPGERRGPVRIALKEKAGRKLKRYAALSVCVLPQNAPSISCVLGFLVPGMTDGPPKSEPDGTVKPAIFAEYAGHMVDEARGYGRPAQVDLIELRGLALGANGLPPPSGEEVISKISSVLRSRSLGGQAASMISEDRFAVVSEHGEDIAGLAGRLAEIGAAEGLKITPETARLEMGDAGGAAGIAALHRALERYAVEGAAKAAAGFEETLAKTISEGEAFKAVVQSGDYRLEYQPVVRMGSARLHHFEALARFGDGVSPDEAIRLAEDLDLIQSFDHSVIERACKAMKSASTDCRIAANISARSLVRPRFVDAALSATGGRNGLGARFLFEVTETAAIHDLEQANAQIQRLRRAGHLVCMDDFGSGSASLDYLRCLDLDIVKIDGRFIRSLTPGGRDERLLSHMVAMCQVLKVQTVAEMIENAATAKIVRQLGIDMGQGWHFCKPLPEPHWADEPKSETVSRRRVGVTESWG